MTNIHYGMLLEMFLDILPPKDKHKSFVVKIHNRTVRFHQKHKREAGRAELEVRAAVQKAERVFRGNSQSISIGAICWVIHNKHKEELIGYGFDMVWFEQMNRYYKAQGVIMSSAKVVSTIEGFIDGKA